MAGSGHRSSRPRKVLGVAARRRGTERTTISWSRSSDIEPPHDGRGLPSTAAVAPYPHRSAPAAGRTASSRGLGAAVGRRVLASFSTKSSGGPTSLHRTNGGGPASFPRRAAVPLHRGWSLPRLLLAPTGASIHGLDLAGDGALAAASSTAAALHLFTDAGDVDAPWMVRPWMALDLGSLVLIGPSKLAWKNSENSMNISDSTLECLTQTILKLKAEKKTRVLKLQEIVEKLHKLWNLMESTKQERRQFAKVVAVLGCTKEDITSPGILSLETIQETQEEVERLCKQCRGIF